MLYRIMLADDEPIMRKALLTLTNWQDMDCEVVYVAENGQEVMDCLETVMPDILITDIKMPGKSGMEISKYIWEEKIPVKVILLTAYEDFSYAQSAVKYGVADYVTKTGVFDELITAVENVKEEIAGNRRSSRESTQEVVVENVFKAIFDSSLYGEVEIEAEFEKLQVKLERYIVMLLQFTISEEREKTGVKAIHQSLNNFLKMVFGDHMVRAIPVERDMFVIVLNEEREAFRGPILQKSTQIIDMLDNFMKLYAFIGVSGMHIRTSELREAYREAQRALSYSFVDRERKISFYRPFEDSGEVYPSGMEAMVEEIARKIQKGSVEETNIALDKLIECQKENNCSAHLIQNTGILIQNKCRTILAEYDKTIYEVTQTQGSISRAIYECRHLEEFEILMNAIVTRTAETIHIAVNKKISLIYDCQKYMEAHFEENIMVTDIARAVGASASYLSRIFKEITGQTIISTMNQMKAEKAKEYLDGTDLKIYEIAKKLGFDNTTYFSLFFKKSVGVSPKEYKEGASHAGKGIVQ